jgi:hypothetical protein
MEERLKIVDLGIGDTISNDQFKILESFADLDFPYKIIQYRQDTNLIMHVIGESNLVYYMELNNIDSSSFFNYYKDLANFYKKEPIIRKNFKFFKAWLCDSYHWMDTVFFDKAILLSCKEIDIDENEHFVRDWRLLLVNDSLYNKLQKQYIPVDIY